MELICWYLSGGLNTLYPLFCVAGCYLEHGFPSPYLALLPCPNNILLLISQNLISLIVIAQPGNKKELTITDYLKNFNAVKFGFGYGVPKGVP
jgi:hypothetical protein